MNTLGTTELIVVVIPVLILIIPLWKICGKTGYSPWLSLLFFVPVVNLVLLYYLAFSQWSILQPNNRSKV